MPQTACRNSKPFRFQDLSKIGIFASRTGSSPPPSSYDNQSLQLFSGSIHLKPMKLGMLVYHIIAQGQIYWFFGNSNYFSKKIVISGFLALSQFHLIPASVTPTFLLFYSSEANETWHACLSHHCAGTIFLFFRNSKYFSKNCVFSNFLGLSKFHRIPASVYYDLQLYYSSEVDKTWHARLSHYCAEPNLLIFRKFELFFEKIRVFGFFGTWSIPPHTSITSTANSCTIRIDWESHYCAGTILC